MSAPTRRYEDAVARYFEAWNAAPDAVAKAVAAAWAKDGGYTDPLADVRGHEQIAAVVAAAHEQFPGFTFRLSPGARGSVRRPGRTRPRAGSGGGGTTSGPGPHPHERSFTP